MSWTVCLQGGAEFGPACRALDSQLLGVAGGGPVVIVPLAGAPGADYDRAAGNGVAYFRELGATEVLAAADPRRGSTAAAAAAAAVRTARLVVLPGGSPARLLAALRSTGIGELVLRRLAGGVVVTGASAGAMVLCQWLALPGREGPDRPELARGLGAVPRALVVPHWSAGRAGWAAAVPGDVDVFGLPECSGVLVRSTDPEPRDVSQPDQTNETGAMGAASRVDDVVTALGESATAVRSAGRWWQLGLGDHWRRR